MTDRQSIQSLDIFVSEDATGVDRLLNEGELTDLPAKTVMLRENDPVDRFYILLEGEIEVLKDVEGQPVVAGRHTAPSYFGEIQLLTDELVPVTLVTVTPCRLLTLSREQFWDIVTSCQDFARGVFRAMANRIRGLQRLVLGREKMASLGTLAAGLAHELNNPAAAVGRSAEQLGALIPAMEQQSVKLAGTGVPADAVDAIRTLCEVRRPDDLAGAGNPLFEGQREEAFEDWLADQGVEEPWTLAPHLARSGCELRDLSTLAEKLPPGSLEPTLRWVVTGREAMALVDQARSASNRISSLVKAVKSYSYMDEAPKQTVDIHDGIEDTLTILGFRLKHGVNVTRNYDRSIPKIAAYGSELNQVWTNIIDNAIDAVDGRGSVQITTRQDDGYAIVAITDDGPGIPENVKSRIFEPFFTTKPQGKGSGLGLDIAYRAVRIRHKGDIAVDTVPGRTTFSVRLPLDRPGS